jgi:hypothetical protein
MSEIIRPKRRLKLYRALQIGYLRNERKQRKRLKRFGYVLDPELSTTERTVAYSPTQNKVIYIVNGSETEPLNNPRQFLKDWAHNLIAIPTGTYKLTPRYRQEYQNFRLAKDKYKDARFTVVGHSQSAQLSHALPQKNDVGISLDPALINQKPRPNVYNYRTDGDFVSAFANDTKTLSNPSKSPNPYQAHDIENIKNKPIYV